MASLSVCFTSDDIDDITNVIAFWDLIQNEHSNEDAPTTTVDNFLRLYDIYRDNISRVYESAKDWNETEAAHIKRRFPREVNPDAT